MSKAGAYPVLLGRSLFLSKKLSIGRVPQDGRARFETDPATSVLDLDRKTHQNRNLYLVDASNVPPIGSIEPILTTIANGLRVADNVKLQLDF